jgi:hypothetical protein
VKSTIFLTLSRHGVDGMTKKKPTTKSDQRCVRLIINVPDEAFETPMLDAELYVAADKLLPREPLEPIQVEVWSDPIASKALSQGEGK